MTIDMLDEADIALFCKKATTLADIKAAGWDMYGSSAGAWWFRHRTGKRFLPTWVDELERIAETKGSEGVRSMLRMLVSKERLPWQ